MSEFLNNNGGKREVIASGNELVALAAVGGGCEFFCGVPL